MWTETVFSIRRRHCGHFHRSTAIRKSSRPFRIRPRNSCIFRRIIITNHGSNWEKNSTASLLFTKPLFPSCVIPGPNPWNRHQAGPLPHRKDQLCRFYRRVPRADNGCGNLYCINDLSPRLLSSDERCRSRPFPNPYRPVWNAYPGEDYGETVVRYIESEILGHILRRTK